VEKGPAPVQSSRRLTAQRSAGAAVLAAGSLVSERSSLSHPQCIFPLANLTRLFLTDLNIKTDSEESRLLASSFILYIHGAVERFVCLRRSYDCLPPPIPTRSLYLLPYTNRSRRFTYTPSFCGRFLQGLRTFESTSHVPTLRRLAPIVRNIHSTDHRRLLTVARRWSWRLSTSSSQKLLRR
jgi:hypothetical protein